MDTSSTPPAPQEDAGQAYERFVQENLKRNYAAHFLHGMLGMTGFRLVNAPTFVPAYLHSVSGSDAWVGLGLSLQQLGGIASPIIGAAQMEHRKRILPISIMLGWLMRLQLLGLAVSGWLLGGMPALFFALAFLFLLGVFQGPQRVAFQFLMAKVIPVRLRGRLNAWRNFTGGIIAAALSWAAGSYLVAGHVFGNGYATTFFLAFVLTSLGLTTLRILMREPEPPSVRARTSFRDRVREVPALIRGDRGFAWFMLARTFAMGMRIGQPFYFLFAASTLGISPESDPAGFGMALAVLSFAYMAADTAMNLVWGYLADRSGFRSVFVIAMVLNLAGIALLFAPGGYVMMAVAFFVLGGAQSAYVMSTTNIVMEFGHHHDMAMRMALSNTAEGLMGAVAPVLGGTIAVIWGYPAAFALTAASVAVALAVLFLKVDEPRRRTPPP